MNASQCDVFHELSRSFEYRLLVLVKAILCSTGALRLLIQWKKYGVAFLVHTNTKTLFRFYVILNIIVSSIFSCIYIFDFVRFCFDCVLLDFRWILLSRGVGISSLFAMQHVMLVLSLERLYSAIYPAQFEKHSSKLLSFSLALIAIVVTLAYSMFELSDSGRLFLEQKIEVALLNVNIPLNTPRYKRSENRRIVLILLPIELCQIVLGFSGSVALFMFSKTAVNSTPLEQQTFLELATYVVYFPLILSLLIQRSVKKHSNRKPLADPQIDHFESLRNSWNF